MSYCPDTVWISLWTYKYSCWMAGGRVCCFSFATMTCSRQLWTSFFCPVTVSSMYSMNERASHPFSPLSSRTNAENCYLFSKTRLTQSRRSLRVLDSITFIFLLFIQPKAPLGVILLKMTPNPGARSSPQPHITKISAAKKTDTIYVRIS